MTEEFAEDSVRDALDADASIAAIQQEAVAIIVVTADSADKGISHAPLMWGHPQEGTIGVLLDRW